MDGKCPECNEDYDKDASGYDLYCRLCNSRHWQDNFTNWTSDDSNIDKIIQEAQLNATTPWECIEWVSYENLENITHLANGGFGSVFKATWKDGRIPFDQFLPQWNQEEAKWRREPNIKVVVKKLRNAMSLSPDFLNEFKGFNQIYGITRDPATREYAIISEFHESGNLRQYISTHAEKMSWKSIIRVFREISDVLDGAHKQERYHKNFHPGNILTRNGWSLELLISDFGLCRPADQDSTDGTIYGVLPFVAPEVLQGQEYTAAADIYSFGMIMLEVFAGEPPFADKTYDKKLAMAICDGERPQIPKYVPSLYESLMKQCWDPIPTNRPTAKDLQQKFSDWQIILNGSLDKLISKSGTKSLSENQQRILLIKEDVLQGFIEEQERAWKAKLAKSAKRSRNKKNPLISQRLDYFKHISQKP